MEEIAEFSFLMILRETTYGRMILNYGWLIPLALMVRILN
jgi:hypothetical protein